MKARIPSKNRDLFRYVCRKDILRVLGYLLWIVAFYMGASSYNKKRPNSPDSRLIVGWKFWVYMLAVVVIGFFVFRIWKFFIDRTFAGEVQRSALSRSYSASQDPNSSEYDFRLNTHLTVRTSNGKLRRIRFEQKDGFYQYYHEGNTVLHFHGLPYPVCTDPEAPYGYVCAACGHHHKGLDSHCAVCGHSLIDPKDLNEQ